MTPQTLLFNCGKIVDLINSLISGNTLSKRAFYTISEPKPKDLVAFFYS